MASAPAFAATPRIGSVAATTNSARDGSGTAPATVITAGSSGTQIREVVIRSTGQPADSVALIWLHDGSTLTLFDEVDLGAPAAGSTTVAAYRTSVRYDNLFLPSGWSLRATVTVAPTSGSVVFVALGADL